MLESNLRAAGIGLGAVGPHRDAKVRKQYFSCYRENIRNGGVRKESGGGGVVQLHRSSLIVLYIFWTIN